MAGIVQLRQAGDALIIIIAGLLKKHGWTYFVTHLKTFYDGLMGSGEIPAEFFDLSDDEKAELAAHWTQVMANEGIGSEHAEFLIEVIMDILHNAWLVFAHFNEGADEAMKMAENDSTKAHEPGA